MNIVFRLKSSHFVPKSYFCHLCSKAWKPVRCIAWKMTNSKHNKCEFCFSGWIYAGEYHIRLEIFSEDFLQIQQIDIFQSKQVLVYAKKYLLFWRTLPSPISRSKKQRVRFKTSVIASRDWHFGFDTFANFLRVSVSVKILVLSFSEFDQTARPSSLTVEESCPRLDVM